MIRIVFWNYVYTQLLGIKSEWKKEERKNKTTLEFVDQYQEPEEFWIEFDNQGEDIANMAHNFVVEGIEDFRPTSPVLYQVCLGTGYLELPQIRYKPKQLSKSYFESKNVYIMDVMTDVYIWYVYQFSHDKKIHDLIK